LFSLLSSPDSGWQAALIFKINEIEAQLIELRSFHTANA
jgi:hypothetical protein